MDWSDQPVLMNGKASWEFWTGHEILEVFLMSRKVSLKFQVAGLMIPLGGESNS